MSSRTPLVALLAAASCATAGLPAPQDAHSFQDVRRIALVRWVDDPGVVRRKDPLDALRESLAERGYDVRLVEIGRGRKTAREVERFYGEVDGRIAVRSTPDRTGSRVVHVAAADAAAALGALGADAMAVYHDFTGQPMLLPPPVRDPLDPLASPGALYPPPADAIPYRPLGALSLVDREGNLVWFDWGSPAPADADAPANAADAIEALLRALAGEPADAA